MGSTQLLLSQKVQQFFRLCQQSMVSAPGCRAYQTGVPARSQCVCLEVGPGVCTQRLSCLPASHSPHPTPLSQVEGRGGACPGPGWGADVPDCLPLLCLLPLQDPTAFPVPTFQDLAGFWDLLQLSIEDVTLKFLELQQLKANSWKLLEPKVGAGPLEPRGRPWKMPFAREACWGWG